MASTERLRDFAKHWSTWFGPEGQEGAYKDMAIKLNEALDAIEQLADLRAQLAEATEELRRRHVAPLLGQSLADAIRVAFENGESHLAAATERAEKAERALDILRDYADRTVSHWDKDEDRKVGKRLAWMAGLSRGYEPKLDWVHEIGKESAK